MKGILQKSARMALFAVVSVSAMGALSVQAEEYKSMIRYDRVWECYENPETMKCMRFDGTDEINGKTYHRIITFHKTSIKYDSGSASPSYTTTAENISQHEGYLREEDKIVYTLLYGYCTESDDSYADGERFQPVGIYNPEKHELSGNWKVVEAPVYDFNYSEGQTYPAVTFLFDSPIEEEFVVTLEDSVEIDERLHKKISIAPKYLWETYEMTGDEFVEGVGAIKYGCLNYHEFGARPLMLRAHNYFNRLFDLDGKVLFISPEADHTELQYGSFRTTDSLDSVESDGSNAAMYDMLGRRIVTPSPGQLYIQGGRKHIGK